MTAKKPQSSINDDERKGLLYGSLIAAGINAARGRNVGDALMQGISGIGQSYTQGLDALYKEKQTNLEQERLAEMIEMERDKFKMFGKEFGMKEKRHEMDVAQGERDADKYRRLVEKDEREQKAIDIAMANMPQNLTPAQKWQYDLMLGLGQIPNIPVEKPTFSGDQYLDTKTGQYGYVDKPTGKFFPIDKGIAPYHKPPAEKTGTGAGVSSADARNAYNKALQQRKIINDELGILKPEIDRKTSQPTGRYTGRNKNMERVTMTAEEYKAKQNELAWYNSMISEYEKRPTGANHPKKASDEALRSGNLSERKAIEDEMKRRGLIK